MQHINVWNHTRKPVCAVERRRDFESQQQTGAGAAAGWAAADVAATGGPGMHHGHAGHEIITGGAHEADSLARRVKRRSDMMQVRG